MYYKTCPHCGAHLDPDEQCDCQDIKEALSMERSTRPVAKTKRIIYSHNYFMAERNLSQ